LSGAPLDTRRASGITEPSFSYETRVKYRRRQQSLRAPARAHRRDLLAAATRVLAAKGFHATKISDIAAAADVGVGTFYLHFPDKEALFDAVVDDTVARLQRRSTRHAPPRADARAQMIAANAAFFASRTRTARSSRSSSGMRRVQRPHPPGAGPLHRGHRRTVRDGVASGLFAPLPPALVAQAVVGMATQMLSWWTEHESVPIDTLIETTTTLALHGFTPSAPAKGASHG
jgi:AcrR family transcriptional regulator